MKCRHCESEAPSSENFCPTCGKPVRMDNPELKKHGGGLFIGRFLILFIAIGAGAGSTALHQLNSAVYDNSIADVTALQGNPKYDQGKVESTLNELHESKDRSGHVTLAMQIVGALFLALFVASFFKPYFALGTAAVLYLVFLIVGMTVRSLDVKAGPLSATFVVIPLLILCGLYYGANAARKRKLAVLEARAQTRPRPVISRPSDSTETPPPGPAKRPTPK